MLSTQHMAEVIAALRRHAADGSDREKRTAPRIEVNGRVVVWPIDEDNKPSGAMSVFVRDISLRGMGFFVAGAVPRTFIVGLPRGRREPVLLHCRTTFSRELADHLFVVGAEFQRALERPSPIPGPDAGPVEPAGQVVEKSRS